MGALPLLALRRYEGDFKHNQLEGHGKYTLNNGDCYEGELKSNMMHGYGICTYSNGDRSVRDWDLGLWRARAGERAAGRAPGRNALLRTAASELGWAGLECWRRNQNSSRAFVDSSGHLRPCA